MQAWHWRRMDLINVLKNASGILLQIRIDAGPISANVTGWFCRWRNVVLFHPRRAQWVKYQMKPLATVTHRHSAVSGSHVQHVQYVV